MVKKIRFNTVSLGSEPKNPEVEELIRFVASFRGQETDLIRYNLIQSQTAQFEAGISSRCVGGRFCISRVEKALHFNSEECILDPDDLILDAQVMVRETGSIHGALPAPHLLSGRPDFSDEELVSDYCDGYAELIRTIRDSGVSTHILHADRFEPIEIERLASRKVRFFITHAELADIELLLEHQSRVFIKSDQIPLLPGLLEQYDPKELVILDPDEETLDLALQDIDVDRILVGGYCSEESEREYWRMIADQSTLTTDQV
ncbi:MAG TPA: hypothetical protein VN372_04220 [Methanospirillum sp.]|nr:hypothetical protein [Methanospirillum sp.]